jgi:aryl-phospho-beta-D-glucosidase BglC (GH1 family)
VWKQIATIYANQNTIAGYDIMNEPPDPAAYSWVVPGLDSSFLVRFYLNVMQSIRSVDTNHAIFLEPTSENAFPSAFYLTPSRVPRDNVIWAPHFYPDAFEPHYSGDLTPLKQQLDLYHQQIVGGFGSPMWIGEYGAFMSDDTYLNWLQDAVNLFNQYQIGSAWWPYHGGPGQQIPAPVAGQ